MGLEGGKTGSEYSPRLSEGFPQPPTIPQTFCLSAKHRPMSRKPVQSREELIEQVSRLVIPRLAFSANRPLLVVFFRLGIDLSFDRVIHTLPLPFVHPSLPNAYY